MDRLDREALLQKAAELRRSGFRPGCDDMSAKSAELWLTVNGERLLDELRRGAYRPMPTLGFRTAKKDGTFRSLTRATAIDTVVQRCLLELLTGECEKGFSDESFAYRPGRGVTAALRRYCELGSAYRLAARLDVADCFGSLDHAVLRATLDAWFHDGALTAQLMRFVAAPLWEDGALTERERGIPQGMPLGPLLCNLYLDALDRRLAADGTPFLRYGDDTVLFGNTREELTAARERALRVLREELKLSPNREKCEIDAPLRLKYLGCRFSAGRDGFLTVQAEDTHPAAFHVWQTSPLRGAGRTAEVLSDGILRQRDLTLLLETEEGGVPIPPMSTDCINIYSNVIFDSGFLKSAAEQGITVNLFDRYGRLQGRFLPHRPLRSLPLTQEQLAAYHDKAHRLQLARAFVLGSIHNLRLNIRYYHKLHPDPIYETALERLHALEAEIKACQEYQSLLLLEAQSRAAYFQCFDRFLAGSGFCFERRSRRPPRNAVNALLSFGNTVLYSYLATEISKTALDVRVGFLHATNTRLESLNLDIAELFRPLLVDRTVFKLINRRQLRPEAHFDRMENGAVYLNAEGKRVFLEEFHEKLNARVTDHAVSKSYIQLMTEEVRKLARHFRAGETYKPFKQVR